MGVVTDKYFGINKAVTFGYAAVVVAMVFLLSADFVSYRVTENLSTTTLIYAVFYLVFDLCVRSCGVMAARSICAIGFVAVFATVVMHGVPGASAMAFLFSMLANVELFSRLSKSGGAWYIAPLVSSLLAGLLDSFLFVYVNLYSNTSADYVVTAIFHNYIGKAIIIILCLIPYYWLMSRVPDGTKKAQ